LRRWSAIGSFDLELPRALDVVQLEHRDVVRAAAEVEHGDLLVLLLVETVGQRRGGRLVDDAQHVEAGNFSGVFRRLALRIVEVGRHRDHGLRHAVAEVVLGGLLHLLQDHRGHFGRGEPLALDLDRGDVVGAAEHLVRHALGLFLHLVELAAHEALDREDGVRRVGDRLTLGDLADESLAVLAEADDRRRGAPTLGVRDDDRIAAFHDGDDRVRGAEVDADDFICHVCLVRR
jgi:NAD-specific glutamate dehydrogenase